MTVDINDVLGATHDGYLQIIKVQAHEIAILKAQLAAELRAKQASQEIQVLPSEQE
jgi:hypothetical protein